MTIPPVVLKLKQYPIAVLSTVIALIFAIMIFMRSGVVNELQEEADGLETRFQLMQRNLINSANLDRELEELEAMVAEMQERLINPSDTIANTRYFYGLENQAGLNISDPNLESVRPISRTMTDITLVNYTVTLNGDFYSIVDFLYLLHSGEHFCRVQSFSLARGRTGTNLTAILNLQFLGTP